MRCISNQVRQRLRQSQFSLPPCGLLAIPEKQPCPQQQIQPSFLKNSTAGAFASQIGHAISVVAAGVVDHGKAGKLVITLDFSQIGESHQVKIKHKLDYKVPTKRGTRSENTSLDTPMHVGTGGRVTLFAEKHDQLFSRDDAPIPKRT